MKKALSDEEWAGTGRYWRHPLSVEPWTDASGRLSVYIMDACEHDDDDAPFTTDAGVELTPADRHALAALCLVGQPFGFTHEDLELLVRVAGRIPPSNVEETDGIANIAERIEALLPPKAP